MNAIGHVTLINTGENTMTGGRLKRIAKYVQEDEAFCFTYGDGVANVDITALLAFHKQHGKSATITAVQPPGRYGVLDIETVERTSVRTVDVAIAN